MASIAASLARQVERYADRLRASHPLLKLAESGSFGADGVAAYLANARFTVAQTSRHLMAAEKRCLELGQASLAALFRKKRREEMGHEVWAENDLSHLSELFGTDMDPPISSYMQDLMCELDRVVATKPSCYLAYALFAEYLTVLLGPSWVNTLEMHCNVPSSALSVITKHVELDKAHVEEELAELDAFIDSRETEAYFDTLHHAMRAFENYLDELFDSYRGSSNAAPVAAE